MLIVSHPELQNLIKNEYRRVPTLLRSLKHGRRSIIPWRRSFQIFAIFLIAELLHTTGLLYCHRCANRVSSQLGRPEHQYEPQVWPGYVHEYEPQHGRDREQEHDHVSGGDHEAQPQPLSQLSEYSSRNQRPFSSSPQSSAGFNYLPAYVSQHSPPPLPQPHGLDMYPTPDGNGGSPSCESFLCVWTESNLNHQLPRR